MAKYLTWGFILAIGLQVAGCYTDYGPIVAAQQPIARSSVAERLEPGERVKVTIYGEDTLNGIYEINPAGYVTMPLAGAMRAAGRTRSELEREITSKYSHGLLQEPKVTVDVVEFLPFYVLGEAEHPGQYPYKTGLNVLTAVTTAGGFTYRASRNIVLIQHAGEQAWQEYALSASVLIAPGDLIRVPERFF